MIVYLAGYKTVYSRWNLDTKDTYLLSSFWEHKSGRYGEYVRQEKHILDSGAFSAFSGNKNNIEWEKYIKKYADFIITNKIKLFFELDIDCLIGLSKVEYYRKYLEDRTGYQSIPVWHKSRGKDYFIDMCENYPYVAIGGIVSNEIKASEYRYLKWFIDTAHLHNCKIHGLGFTKTKYLSYLNFDSIDSTTWLSGARYGQIYIFDGKRMKYYDPPKGQRAVSDDSVNKHNFKEWVKFQKYAEKSL